MFLVLAVAATVFATPVAFAGGVAGSSSNAGVNGGSLGSSSVTVTASDKGQAEAANVFGVNEAESSNVATGTETSKGFTYTNFQAGGNSFADEVATHF